jgi:hypothetical protein
MARSIRRFGTNITRPGVVTHHNLDGLINLDLGAEAAVLVVGEAYAGQPQANAATPVVHEFTDPQDMVDYFYSGNLADMARCLFDPAMAGQTEQGVPVGGCVTVYAIKTNQSTTATLNLVDSGSTTCLTLTDRYYGVLGNSTWAEIVVSGTGLQLTIGRDVAPDIGEQASILFSITGTDEWFSVTYTGVAATCTMDFDGTTFTTTTAGAVDDLSIVAGTYTVSEMVSLINAAASGDYTAAILRADRTNTQFALCDEFAAVNIRAVVASQMGVTQDMVAWVNANSFYCTATWVRATTNEPDTVTKSFLSGGTTGVTTAASVITDALRVASRYSPRFVCSGYNAPVGAGGAVTMALINAEFNTHATNCNALGVACERQVFICNADTTKAAMYATIGAFNNEYMAVVNNRIYRENAAGTRTWLGAHCAAAEAAAIMAGSPIATPLTHKYVNAADMDFVATDFDPNNDTDFNNAILYGLLFLETVPGTGIRFAKAITTYRLLDNDARTHLEVVEARIRHRVILRRALDVPEIGHKGRGTRTTDSILRAVIEAHRAMADPDDPDFILVEGTDAAGEVVPPYRNIRVSLSGDVVTVTGEVTFTEAITWIINDFRATLPSAVSA